MLLNQSIFPVDSKPYGVTYAEWSEKWWQWLLKIPRSISPLEDMTGKNAYVHQIEPYVFFLCQTNEGIKEQPERRIRIPRGRSIFMPILNWISNFYEDGRTEEELTETAKKRMNGITNMYFEFGRDNITGLEKYRVLSRFFDVELPEDNILDLPPGRTRVISDGYWVFTQPILDEVTISSLGSCSAGKTKIGVKYYITVT
jgi:hypothetical protein